MQRKGGRRRSAGEQDVEAVLDELYTTPPSDFVARRETAAAAAKAAGRVDDARRIHAARRPTLAAWAANLLLRSQPEESQQFLHLGQALREAYRALDADGLKDLFAQRRRVVSALSRQTAQLAREAGHPLSESVQQDLEATLRAVLANPDAADQWAVGRLVNALPPTKLPGHRTAGREAGHQEKRTSARRETQPRRAQTLPVPRPRQRPAHGRRQLARPRRPRLRDRHRVPMARSGPVRLPRNQRAARAAIASRTGSAKLLTAGSVRPYAHDLANLLGRPADDPGHGRRVRGTCQGQGPHDFRVLGRQEGLNKDVQGPPTGQADGEGVSTQRTPACRRRMPGLPGTSRTRRPPRNCRTHFR